MLYTIGMVIFILGCAAWLVSIGGWLYSKCKSPEWVSGVCFSALVINIGSLIIHLVK